MSTQHTPDATPPVDGATPVNWHRGVPTAQSATVDEAGKLPLNEVLSDRIGASSPFGDDVTFPVDPKGLNYYHPGR